MLLPYPRRFRMLLSRSLACACDRFRRLRFGRSAADRERCCGGPPPGQRHRGILGLGARTGLLLSY